MHACYTTPMFTKVDALTHLPRVNAGPWKHFRGCYKRHVAFNCDHNSRRYALLKVYADDEGAAMVFISLDGFVCELSVGEHADPFNTANETLVAFSRDCNCHTNMNGDLL